MMMFYFGILFSDFGYLLVLFILISKIPNFFKGKYSLRSEISVVIS
jgi:hypothetical protein